MTEMPIVGNRVLCRLEEFATGRQLKHIRAMLWREAGLGDAWWVPQGWQPDPAWVAVIDLNRVDGIGRISRKVIDRWLEANGMAAPRAVDLQGGAPHWGELLGHPCAGGRGNDHASSTPCKGATK